MITAIILIIVGLLIVVISRAAPISVPVQRIFDIVGAIVAVIGLVLLVFALVSLTAHPVAAALSY